MIRATNLSKKYYPQDTVSNLKRFFRIGEVVALTPAVDDISFEIPDNQTVGIIGPNGAGKTTTIKMLTGLLRPTSGQILVDTYLPFDLQTGFKQSIALFRGGYPHLDDGVVVRDQLEDRLGIYRQPLLSKNIYVRHLIKLTQSAGLLNSVPDNLSQGQRHLVEFIASILHRPRYIFLDEPMLGLDILAIGRFKKVIRYLKKRLRPTIILTSHILPQVVDLSDRIILINRGRIVLDDTPDNIINQNTFDRQVRLHLTSRQGVDDLPAHITVNYPWAVIKTTKENLERDIDSGMKRFQFDDIRVTEPSVEQIFTKYYT